MTWSAPIEATISAFCVLHTPVTSAPNALASCTANVPTPPDAPLIKTLCPGRTRPLSRSACNAVHPATGTDAACSNVRPSGFASTAPSWRTLMYSARVPRSSRPPNTSSPGRSPVTLLPTASTDPAQSAPSLLARALGRDNPARARTRYGVPPMKCQSSGLTDAARTRTSTSSSPIAGTSTSRNFRTSGGRTGNSESPSWCPHHSIAARHRQASAQPQPYRHAGHTNQPGRPPASVELPNQAARSTTGDPESDRLAVLRHELAGGEGRASRIG